MQDLLDLAAGLNTPLHIIECVCDDAIVQQRLERDQVLARHPARNRTYALYQELKAHAEPITVPHLLLDTCRLPLEDCVARILAFLAHESDGCSSV